MAVRAYYETATGKLVSIGSVWPESTPDGLSFVEVESVNLRDQMWDAATQTFVTRPPKVLVDRLDDLASHPNYEDFRDLWANLSLTRRQQLRAFVIRLLGRQRYRAAGEPLEL